ncbi:MAG: thiamine diphosphokinase [Acetivibrionales bacterium]|jgi:thiamine pyrophosphokinase
MKTLIVGSGNEISSELVKKHYSWADFVIAADGGLMHLKKAHLIPDLLIGDFDSLPANLLKEARQSKEIEVAQFPPQKDLTDLELALNLAIEKGTTHLVILGATGNRLDHTTANIHLLYKLMKNNISGYIEDNNNRIYMTDKELILEREYGYNVSILPLPPVANGVTTKGLVYKLDNADLSFGTGLGVSNEFNDEKAVISVRKGLLLVFLSKD